MSSRTGSQPTSRRAALALLAVTAAAWSVGARAQGAQELRIGFQKGSFNLVQLKSLGAAGSAPAGHAGQLGGVSRPGRSCSKRWRSAASISAAVGDSPPVFAQAAGKDLYYVGAEPAKPDSSAILVKPDAPLKTLADLKGRRVALQKGSSSHFLTVQALKKGGLSWIGHPGGVPAAGRCARGVRARRGRCVGDLGSVLRGGRGGGRRARAGHQPRPDRTTTPSTWRRARSTLREPTLRTLFAVLTEADAHVQAHRKEAAQRYADFAGLGLATVHRVLERRPPSPVGPLTAALVAEQQQVADAFAQLQLIPKPIRVADIVWRPGAAVASR